METFLGLVATDLYKKTNGDLSHTAIVFPNRRASIFFNQYLAQQSEKPLWAPTYFSISDLFQQLSTLKLGDSLQLVCELYKAFKQETGSQETLDDFYFWGELLIGDFDDLDNFIFYDVIGVVKSIRTKEQFKKFLENDGSDFAEKRQAVLNKIQTELGTEPMEDPFEYVKKIQEEFDYSKIKFTVEYYDVLGLEFPG